MVLLAACKEEAPELPPPLPVEEIPGKWDIHLILTQELQKVKKKSMNDYQTLMSEMIDSAFMYFSTDSTFIGRFGDDVVGGHWEVSADHRSIITTDIKGEIEVLRIRKLTRDSMNLQNLSYASGITLYMSKDHQRSE